MFLQYVEARQRRLTMRYATLLLLVLSNSVSSLTTIQVCQNKDCCKRFQGSTNLVHTLENLGLCRVETTGCLSHCDKGPNVCINDRTIHGIRTVEDAIDTAQSVAEVPTKLVAAVNVMERGQKGTSRSVTAIRLHSIESPAVSKSSGLFGANCSRQERQGRCRGAR